MSCTTLHAQALRQHRAEMATAQTAMAQQAQALKQQAQIAAAAGAQKGGSQGAAEAQAQAQAQQEAQAAGARTNRMHDMHGVSLGVTLHENKQGATWGLPAGTWYIACAGVYAVRLPSRWGEDDVTTAECHSCSHFGLGSHKAPHGCCHAASHTWMMKMMHSCTRLVGMSA
eukprot:1153609-Pelagomonas_calceolata.AAC.2